MMLELVALLFVLALVLGFIALIIGLFIFWIMMIIDCANRDFPNNNDKVIWILVLVFLGVLGGTIYYFAVKRKNSQARGGKNRKK